MIQLIRNLIPEKHRAMISEWKKIILDGYAVKSYSQEGEDLILRRLFENEEKGFYIDIGAHHPKRFSNTYYLYKLGWRGINIDAMPGSMKAFNKMRPEDINVECGISDVKGEMPYFMFREPALNTFSEELAADYIRNGQELVRKEVVKVYPLTQILDSNLRNVKSIDLMSIDVEGIERKVISSNNWEKYRPRIIVIEVLDFDLSKAETSAVYKDLSLLNYKLYAKTVNSLFFVSRD